MSNNSHMHEQLFSFQLHAVDARCAARRSSFTTPHGLVELPAFMPVATQGTVKGVTIDALRETGTQMVLGNTYHLALRPGDEVVAQLGGLHKFMGWDGPILTDSGGFQIFSLAKLTRIDDSGAEFRSHLDGSLMHLSPERAVKIQENLGSDIAMILDHVVELPAGEAVIRDACERSIRWSERCLAAHQRVDQTLFAIVQGGLDENLRVECSRRLVDMDFTGYAIGGLSVGEAMEDMYRILDVTCPVLPDSKPRYLMGVGRPRDILEAIRRGVDLFDCVMPTRNGRNALAFTDEGPLRMRNLQHQTDPRPLDPSCSCLACRHSRGYLRHLFMADEMLGPMLLSLHNITYYQRLVADARIAIEQDCFLDFYEKKLRGWGEAA